MLLNWIGRLRCPYCAGRFSVAQSLEASSDRLLYGMVECNCFEFPVVDGVLLLSLSKGYGGAEDAMIPYAPFMAAAVFYFKANNLSGFKRWICDKSPFLARLMFDEAVSFHDFMLDYNRQYNTYTCRYLDEQKRQYDVVGERLGEGMPVTPSGEAIDPQSFEDMLFQKMGRGGSYYLKRFFDPTLAVTRNLFLNNKPDGYVLSLCCGQGAFEHLVAEHLPAEKLVSLDAQLINLFITKRFVRPEGLYLCHDVSFPLPFEDDFLSAVFASTCLPELVSQAQVLREVQRVTHPSGWAFVEHIWVGKPARYVPSRYYRFLQNQFETFNQYLDLFRLQGDAASTWLWSYRYDGYQLSKLRPPTRLVDLNGLQVRSMHMLSVAWASNALQLEAKVVPFTEHEERRLRISPFFEVECEGHRLQGQLRRGLTDYLALPFPRRFELDLRRTDDAEYLRQLFQSGVLTLLPDAIASRFPTLQQWAQVKTEFT